MNAIAIFLMLLPFFAFFPLAIAIRMGKLHSAYVFAVVTLATVILGVVTMSAIKPLNFNPTTFSDTVSNILVASYVVAVIYGAWGAKSKKIERTIIGAFIILLICLTSAVI